MRILIQNHALSRMSNLLKFFIMAVAWLIFTALTFYTCVKPKCCTDASVAAIVDDPSEAPPAAADGPYALYSTLGAATAATGSLWPQLRDRLSREYAADPDQRLEVYGHYYSSEEKPAGFENMGFLRAEEIKKRLTAETDIPAGRIATLSRLVPNTAPPAGEQFDAGVFVWEPLSAGTDANGGQTGQVIELSRDNIKIRFPYDESTKSLDDDTESYLRKLAQRLQQTDEQVTVIGHTDIRGTDAYNRRLGQQRADFVRQRLVSYGAPGGQIRTTSQGESQPEASGSSADAHRRNRRAEITLLR